MALRRSLITLLLLLLFSTSGLAQAGSWDSYAGNDRNTGVANSDIPTNVSEQWEYRANGTASSPTVIDKKVYIGTFSGNYIETTRSVQDWYSYARNSTGQLYSMNAATGEILWNFSTTGSVWSTPAYEDGTVYVGSFAGTFYAVNSTSGKLDWKFDTQQPIFSPPAVSDNAVYFGNRGYNAHEASADEDYFIYSLNKETGEIRWKTEAYGGVYGSPAVYDGTVYIGDQRGNVSARDTSDGGLIWSFKSEGRENTADPAERFGLISSLTVVEDTVYVPSYDGTVYAVDTETGDKKWRINLESNIASSPAVTENLLYIGTYDGNFYAISRRTGNVTWKKEIGSRITKSSPAVAKDVVVFGTRVRNGSLYALDAHDGTKRWRYNSTGQILSSPAIVNNTVYFSTTGGIYSLANLSNMNDSSGEIYKKDSGFSLAHLITLFILAILGIVYKKRSF